MTEVPPKTYLGFKKLAPGDPGYDKAHFNECIDDKPLRFNSK